MINNKLPCIIYCIFIATYNYASTSNESIITPTFTDTKLNNYNYRPERPAYTYTSALYPFGHASNATRIYTISHFPDFESIVKHIERRIATSPNIKVGNITYKAEVVRTYDDIKKINGTINKNACTAYVALTKQQNFTFDAPILHALSDTTKNFTIPSLNNLPLTINEHDLITLRKDTH